MEKKQLLTILKEKIKLAHKEYLIKLLEAGKITAKAAADIIGTGINKIINSRYVYEGLFIR